MEAAFAFAENISQVEYQDIPAEAVEAAKRSILDTLGTTIAASAAAPGCKELVELVKEAGGKGESTIIAFGGKVPCWMAAFANGALSHSLDYDDTHDKASVHPGNATVPAALAVAERVGKVSGKVFLTAVVLGQDMVCRLGLASSKTRNLKWNPAHLHGNFGATAVAGKLLGLSRDRLVDAFGIALSQAGGSLESGLSVGSILRGMYPGFSGYVGVLSAMMAAKGISGPQNSLEGKAGLFNAYYAGEYDQEALLRDLGKKFEGVDISFKPWPCDRVSQLYVGATLSIMNERSIKPEEVKEISVWVGDVGMNMCQPLEARRAPATTLDAKFSILFPVAAAAVKGGLEIKDFMPEALNDPEVLRMAQKVVPKYDAQLGQGRMTIAPGVVELTTNKGATFRKRVETAYGHPDNPMTKEDLDGKFRRCLAYSVKSEAHQKESEHIIHLVDRLEQVEDMRELVQLLG